MTTLLKAIGALSLIYILFRRQTVPKSRPFVHYGED